MKKPTTNKMEQHKEKKWYDNKLVVTLLCIVFFPVGLYALWKSNTISKGWKVGVTIVIALFVVIGVSNKDDSVSSTDTISANSQPDKDKKNKASETPTVEAQKAEQQEKIAKAEQQKKEAERAEIAAQKEKVSKAIDQAYKNGLLQKVDSPRRTVYLSPIMWRAVNAGTKQDIVNVMAQYMGHLNDMDQAVGLTVKDWQSGKTIAEYSIWSGVSIN
jgi:hypothetical protein